MKFVFKDPFTNENEKNTLESEMCIMTFTFNNPNATCETLVFDTDHPSFDDVRYAIATYFSSAQPRLFLANALTTIADFSGEFAPAQQPHEYRDSLMSSAQFATAVNRAVDTFSSLVLDCVRRSVFSADVWWSYIQQLLREASRTDIPRAMFIDDTYRPPLSDDMRIVNIDRSEYTISRTELFNQCAESFDSASIESAMNRLASEYVHKNYEQLITLFCSTHPDNSDECAFAQFLRDFHRCAAIDMYLLLSDLCDVADPLTSFCE